MTSAAGGPGVRGPEARPAPARPSARPSGRGLPAPGLNALRSGLVAATAAVAALLASCGGGEEPRVQSTADAAALPAPLLAAAAPRARPLAVVTDPKAVADIERLMDWAETAFPQYFPTHQTTRTADPYRYRHYPQTDNYLGVDGVFIRVLGPISGGVVLDVGTLDDYACSVSIATCLPPGFARQPASVTVAPGAVVSFSAELTGGPSIQVQWLRDGQPVESGGTITLSFTATAADNGARFSLRAENAKGLVFSEVATLTVAAAVDGAAMQALAQARGCFECHGIERAGSGPAWRAVAQRYDGVAGAAQTLAGRIANGSSRIWGPASAMPAQPVSAAEAANLAAWILTLK